MSAKKAIRLAFVIAVLLMLTPGNALAQDYYFQVPVQTVEAFWNEDGTLTAYYTLVFQNDPSGHAIEFVDLGLKNSYFDINTITADINGQSVAYISSDEFEGQGADGVAIALGPNSIPPGGSGTVHVLVGKIENVLYEDDEDSNYVSAVLSNAYFVSDVVYGDTDLTMIFHLPPGVTEDEPRWHESPPDFPPQPETSLDENGRVTYTWRSQTANSYTQYFFGASFPKEYVPESAIVTQAPLTIRWDFLMPILCIGFFILIIVTGARSSKRRQLQYLPPKISIEGMGIKRGLTAVESAILLEQPLEKVLTMILFGVIKKEAAEVEKRDPLSLKFTQPQPEGLLAYETDFINAMRETGSTRAKEMREMVVRLVKSVSEKMKGFSRKETVAYYKDIVQRAWGQVQAADTPEVKSEKFDQGMEWMMMDDDFDGRTRDVFRHQPIFLPGWWGGYDPTFRSMPKVSPSMVSGAPARGATSLPHLPGSDFAASIANGVQGFSSGVVGNIGAFTTSVTAQTNPIPKSTSSPSRSSGRSGGSSCACACACACAGCACACAGGGR